MYDHEIQYWEDLWFFDLLILIMFHPKEISICYQNVKKQKLSYEIWVFLDQYILYTANLLC